MIDPAHEAYLETMPEDAMVSVMIYLADRVPLDDLDASFKAERATLAARHERVISSLVEKAADTQLELLAELARRKTDGEVVGYTPYWIANMVVAKMTVRAVREVAARPDVAVVEPNFTVEPVEPVVRPPGRAGGSASPQVGATPGLRAINADRVWYELGITGAGRLIGNIDSGVMGEHVALASRWRGAEPGIPWHWAWHDVFGTTTFPFDEDGHGTHVMGTMVGLGEATGDTVGVAWGAQWIASNAIHRWQQNPEFDSDVTAAFQWFADPDGDPQTVDDVPDAVQNSWGFGGSLYSCDTRWWDVIDACEVAGCAVVFSAGNEGPGSQTIRSPADRIATPTNAYAVGAVDATYYGFPYPVAVFSSRGPSECDQETKKPEVVAPGVDVYSSTNDGGYQSAGWSGTSMAGPHVAGIFALLREAVPNLDVRTMKQLIMFTARDLETPGEDNAAGWGVVDAYAAVTTALDGGHLEGTVTSATSGHPIPNALVTILGLDFPLATDGSGAYAAILPTGTLDLEASHPAFLPETQNGVQVTGGQHTVVDWVLAPAPDSEPPEITQTLISGTSCLYATDMDGPYPVSAMVTDNLGLLAVHLVYRVDGGAFLEVPMDSPGDNRFTAAIPIQAHGSVIDWYLRARDWQLNETTAPPEAPDATYTFLYDTPDPIFADDVEIDRGWALGIPGDTATRGRWERGDPPGTWSFGTPVQPEDDHTPDPGVQCFVTELGNPGEAHTVHDVDGGCTTLVSPVFDLTGAVEAVFSYWRWWVGVSDSLHVEASSDGGENWTVIEHVTGLLNDWNQVTIPLRCFIDLTPTVRVRFQACDLATDGVVEAAIDDIVVSRFDRGPTGIAAARSSIAGPLRLEAVRPNPFTPVALVSYEVAQRESVRLEVYDVTGRLVRTLVDGVVDVGMQRVVFDGRGEGGQNLASGTYFLRIEAGGRSAVQKVSLVR
jgi:subtilisin family serine protease